MFIYSKKHWLLIQHQINVRGPNRIYSEKCKSLQIILTQLEKAFKFKYRRGDKVSCKI